MANSELPGWPLWEAEVHGALRPRLPELLAIFALAAERSAGYTEVRLMVRVGRALCWLHGGPSPHPHPHPHPRPNTNPNINPNPNNPNSNPGCTEVGGARGVDMSQWLALAARCGAADGP